ncbi:hypothetical protein HOB10_01890 [Candidatus Parcubacteria bacterium]|jgi:hypothetical protein|nr:hypothetical protein [Candidatus Parcubacteria bacterium]
MLKSHSGSYVILVLLAILLAGAVFSISLMKAPTKQLNIKKVDNISATSTGDSQFNHPLYCEKDDDCTLQTPVDCNICGCGTPVNVQNYVTPRCDIQSTDCDNACPQIDVNCVNNRCIAQGKNNWQVVDNIDIVNQQFTFDGCGQLTDYTDYSWYPELEQSINGEDIDSNDILELCYSKNAQMVVFIVEGSYCKSGDIYRLDIGRDNMLHANVIDHDRGCLAGFREFGKRVGNNIKVTGIDGDAGCTAEMYYDYNFMSNSVELISEYDWCFEDKENGDWSYHAGSLCEDEPTITAIGRARYPVHPKYSDQLHFLGELFTADECGADRLAEIHGVYENQYTLGSSLSLEANPSAELIDTLDSIGYFCTVKTNKYRCDQWELMQIVPLDDILQLKPYYKELKSDDCLNCG